MKEFLDCVTPSLVAVLIAVIGYIGKQAIKLIPIAQEFIISRIGLNNYKKYKLIAWDVWNIIEEDCRLGQLTDSKITVFESLIKAKIPSITDDEIKTLRQAVAGEFNKDKPIVQKELELPIQEVPITPVVKYVAPDGTELKPIQ